MIKRRQVMNVFEYAAVCESNWKENLCLMTDYKPFTTFYSDLSIADFYGENSVKETYDNVLSSWLEDYKYFTEFIMCLNHKAWEMDARSRNESDMFGSEKTERLCELYSVLYDKAYEKFFERYEGDKDVMNYYYKVMD